MARILVVDDEIGIRELLSEILYDEGHTVEIAENAAQARAARLRARPDLVLLDINLPLKNGYEVLDEIKSNEETRKIPVIILSTSSDRRDIDKAYDKHVNCFITKPLDIGEFIESISKIEEFWIQLVKLPSKE